MATGKIAIGLLLAATAGSAGCSATAPDMYDSQQAYLSVEQRGIFLVDVDQVRKDPAAFVWSWKAADSPEIPSKHRAWFNGYDECKPVMNGTCVLVCSSWNGAVALVRRGDKKCLFYAAAPGAHSADLVGTDLLAAATSKEDGELRLYSLKGPKVLDAQPLWSTKLSWGHGVVWDAPRKELWALGTSELLKLRVSATTHPSSEPATQPVEASATVLQRWELPASGGHDLYPYDADHLVVTSGPMSWLFDVATGQFSPLPGLADRKGLISVSRNTQTGQVMFTQTVGETSHADHLGFACQKDLSLPYKLLYKARWNTPAPR